MMHITRRMVVLRRLRDQLGWMLVVPLIGMGLSHALAPTAAQADRRTQAIAAHVAAPRGYGAIAKPGVKPPPGARGKSLIINKGAYPAKGKPRVRTSIMVLDLATGTIDKTLPAPVGLHEAAFSPDNTLVVAPQYGAQPSGAPISRRGGNAIVLMDLATLTTQSVRVPTYMRLHGVEFLDDARVAITADGTRRSIEEGYVLIFNVKTKRVEHTIATGQKGAHLVKRALGGAKLYVSNIQSGSVSVIDAATNRVEQIIPTGAGAEGLGVTNDGNQVWVLNQLADTISIIDAKTQTVTRTLPAAGVPIRIQFLPDSRRALVTFRGSNELAIYDVASGAELKRIAMGVPAIEAGAARDGTSSVPTVINLHPDGHLVYVSNTYSQLVTAVDLTKGVVVGHYKAGIKPEMYGWFAGE